MNFVHTRIKTNRRDVRQDGDGEGNRSEEANTDSTSCFSVRTTRWSLTRSAINSYTQPTKFKAWTSVRFAFDSCHNILTQICALRHELRVKHTLEQALSLFVCVFEYITDRVNLHCSLLHSLSHHRALKVIFREFQLEYKLLLWIVISIIQWFLPINMSCQNIDK